MRRVSEDGEIFRGNSSPFAEVPAPRTRHVALARLPLSATHRRHYTPTPPAISL